MGNIEFDTDVMFAEPMKSLGHGCFAMHLYGYSWTVKHNTDGFLSNDDLATMWKGDHRRLLADARKLVAAGFWAEVPGGFRVLEVGVRRSEG